jgi:hypothetical protein
VVAYDTLPDQRVTAEETIQIAIALATAAGVHLVPLAPR